MITINDDDMPITVAQKIVTGTRPYNPTPLMRSFCTMITGDDCASDTVDMFDANEIKEIADYLLVFCKHLCFDGSEEGADGKKQKGT